MAPNNSKVSSPTGLLKAYLVTYNLLSALGWSHILVRTVRHLLHRPKKSPTSRTLRARASTTYDAVGKEVAYVQTAAILEMIHTLLSWVNNSPAATVLQVITRQFVILGIRQSRPLQTSPFYAAMVVIWSIGELARYPFYAMSLLSFRPKLLTYLRYNLFYVLIPCGAFSEYFLIWSTLPSWKDFVKGKWKLGDMAKLATVLVGFPAMLVLYRQRIRASQKVLGSMRS